MQTVIELPVFLLRVTSMQESDYKNLSQSEMTVDGIYFGYINANGPAVNETAVRAELREIMRKVAPNLHNIAVEPYREMRSLLPDFPTSREFDLLYKHGINPIVPDRFGSMAAIWGSRYIQGGIVHHFDIAQKKYVPTSFTEPVHHKGIR